MYNTPIFDKELLLRDIIGISVAWWEDYNSSPTIQIRLKPGIEYREYFQQVATNDIQWGMYDELRKSTSASRIYYAQHPMGFVKYFSHSGTPNVNEGGFGGAISGVHTNQVFIDGNLFIPRTPIAARALRGPWSSRATAVNTYFPDSPRRHIMDVDIIHGKERVRRAAGAMLIDAVRFLAEHFQPEFHIVREAGSSKVILPNEQNPYTASISPSKLKKPGGKCFASNAVSKELEILYSPKNYGRPAA